MTTSEFKTMINTQIVSAMKDKNVLRLETLRSINNGITLAEKATPNTEINYIDVLKALAKQRKQSIDSFKAANQIDAANKEIAELAIIETFLPQGPSEAETKAAVDAFMLNNTSEKNVGKLIGLFAKDPANAIYEMKIVSAYIKSKI